MAMLPEMLRRDRERWGMSVGEAGCRLGITRRAYVAIDQGVRIDGTPNGLVLTDTSLHLSFGGLDHADAHVSSHPS